MARFDVHRSRDSASLWLNCQAELLDDYKTRFVVPLMSAEDGPKIAGRLNPVFEIEGSQVAMFTQYAGAIPKSELGEFVTSLADHDMAILSAIDMLISGY